MDLIENRKSIRKYLDKNIPNDVIKKVLDAGRLAPSWVNVQPWHFIVVRKNKEILSELSNNQPQVRKADVVIVCVADTGAWDKERFSEVLKQKGMNDSGIDSLLQLPVLYPPLLGEQKVKHDLNLNDRQVILAMLTLGYPDDNRETVKLRKDFDEVVSEEKLGQPFVV